MLLCVRVVTTGRQLAKSLELQSLNDLGFSKRYVRCLQVCLDESGWEDDFFGKKTLLEFSSVHV